MAGGPHESETLDDVVRELRELRLSAGAPSYAEIAARATTLREARGLAPAAARVPRSSVYDLFRPGRSRLSAELVVDVAVALGADDATAGALRRRVAAASTGAARPAASPADDPRHLDGVRGADLFTVVFAVASLGLNLFGNTVAGKFGLPIWLDTIGTAAAAFVLGPWHGVGVGVGTNLLATVSGHPESLDFAPVSAIAALVWGYGARWLGVRQHPWRLLPLGVAVAVACSLTAAPLTVLVVGGLPAHGSAGLIASLTEIGADLWGAVFSANLLFSLVDKLLSTWIAYGLAIAALRLLPDGGAGLSGFVRRPRTG